VTLEEIPAERAGGVVAGVKPAIETFGVKPLATRATLFTWQLIGRAVKYRVTDIALFNAFKTLVYVTLP